MRRLILEFDVDEVAKFLGEDLKKIDFMDVVTILKEGPEEAVLIVTARLKDPAAELGDLHLDVVDKIRVLDRSKDGTYTLFWKGRPIKRQQSFWKGGGYLTTPYEIRNGKLKVTWLGNAKEVKSFLRFVERAGVRFKVDLLTDAKFSPDSPLHSLTDKQRRVLTTAFNLGYYDVPRRMGSDELASRLGITNQAFVMHRRKAERRLLSQIMAES
jgi:hypothetical protein